MLSDTTKKTAMRLQRNSYKTRVVLDLNTRVKVIHASKRDTLSAKQVMKMFNVGKTQVYKILKMKPEIL
jgi:hypothetical protein